MLDVDQVHRAAHPLAEAVAAAHQLGHHALDRRALGDRVAVGAVAAVDHVVVAQLRADARRDRLLADAEMDQPVDLVALLEPPDALLEVADAPHRGEQARGVVHAGARVPSSFCTAPTIRAASGITACSSTSL